MFHSSAFTMASNITPDEDEQMHLAGLNMTHGSLQGILDGDEVNVSTAFPTVPLDATDLFINPNQTLADIIPGQNLGPLSSLKIMDADLIIRNLNNELNAIFEKNDQSTALLQRMDQHQKQIETQLVELKAETKRLEEEKETTIREKCDYTINQERLGENIWRDLEKEYADRAQDYLKQLKDEMRAKIESKMTVIRDQYKTELNQEIEKLKAEWAQEHLKTNEQHNAQISQVVKEVEALKEQSHTQPKAKSNEPGDKISGLKATTFNFMPGMVNTQRVGTVNIHDDTILCSKNDDAPPIPPCKQDEKHIHFTSTPCHPVQSNLFDLDDENPIIGHSGNPFISNPGNPFMQQPVRSQIPAQTMVDTDATTIIGNTMSAVASEFKKMREPKIAKLKGGITSGASLFFNSWVKDVRAGFLERFMSNAESLQLVKDYTEGKACQQVEFYIVSTSDPNFEGLINNLRTSFQSGEDEATIKGEFYSHKQYSKESVDNFADVLQLLARKVLNVDPSFQMFMNKSLCQQLANGLKDPGHGISARSILNQWPYIQFASFRSDLVNILGCCIHMAGAKGRLCIAAMAPESPEIPVPMKHRKKEEESTITAQLSMCIKDNQELHKKLDVFDPNKIMEVIMQAVAGVYQKSFQKPNTYQKSTNPSVPSQQKPQACQNTNPFGKPYLGPPREPQVTPGADCSLNPALSCKYCKDTGHNVSNCAKVKRKEALKAAAASQQPNIAKKGNYTGQGQGIVIPASSKFMIPNSFSVNVYTMNLNWMSYTQWLHAKLLLTLNIITLWNKQWLCAPK